VALCPRDHVAIDSQRDLLLIWSEQAGRVDATLVVERVGLGLWNFFQIDSAIRRLQEVLDQVEVVLGQRFTPRSADELRSRDVVHPSLLRGPR